MKLLRKTLDLNLELKGDGDDAWTFTGYGNTFNHKDRVGDITMPGAFSKSLERHRKSGTMPALCMHHDLKRPVGKFLEVEEDSVGLSVRGELTKGVRDAEEARLLMKADVLTSMSIGYIPVEEEWDRDKKANLLHEVDIFEISLVTIPANQQSLITGVKDADGKPLIRQLELALREAGLSRREAKAVLSSGFSAVEEDPSEELEDLEDLTKSFELLGAYLERKLQ